VEERRMGNIVSQAKPMSVFSIWVSLSICNNAYRLCFLQSFICHSNSYAASCHGDDVFFPTDI
jgi:hypothetical protein